MISSACAPRRDPTDTEPHDWVTALRDPANPVAQQCLHRLLVRAARAETTRRGARLRLVGPELDDLAHQAADDAMIAILRKLDDFRGESRFTTWAYKFVIYEVSSKVTRHFWGHGDQSMLPDRWDRLPDRLGYSPELEAESGALLAAVRHAVERVLTDRQREAFLAIVVDGVALDVFVERSGTNRNAAYKTVFDARRKIRRWLVTNGYLDDHGGR